MRTFSASVLILFFGLFAQEALAHVIQLNGRDLVVIASPLDDTIVLAGNSDFQSFTVTLTTGDGFEVVETFDRVDVDSISVYAGAGDDTVINTLLDDSDIRGQDGNDDLQGGYGDDVVYGGNGNDKIVGRNGDDRLYGQNGDDKIYGVNGDDEFFGGNGNDILSGGNGDDKIYGGAGNDRLYGGAGEDVITGWDGDDRIFGQAGDDILAGQNDDDFIVGGNGIDRILGGNGDDVLSGNAGDDFLYGNGGDDEMNGGTGDDFVRGDAGDDAVLGNEGDDTVRGEAGADYVSGGIGFDELEGGAGPDTFDLRDENPIVDMIIDEESIDIVLSPTPVVEPPVLFTVFETFIDAFTAAVQLAGVTDTDLLDDVNELVDTVGELRDLFTSDADDLAGVLAKIDQIDAVITRIQDRGGDTPGLDALADALDGLKDLRTFLTVLSGPLETPLSIIEAIVDILSIGRDETGPIGTLIDAVGQLRDVLAIDIDNVGDALAAITGIQNAIIDVQGLAGIDTTALEDLVETLDQIETILEIGSLF